MAKFKHKGFENIPVEEDTRVRSSKLVEIAGFDAVHEIWTWDGIVGESLIFRESDLNGMDDKALQRLVTTSSFCPLGGTATSARDRQGYAFVNFNFVS